MLKLQESCNGVVLIIPGTQHGRVGVILDSQPACYEICATF